MGDYINGKSSKRSNVTKVNIPQQIDIEALASALAQKMPSNMTFISGAPGQIVDDFDNELSMEKLADSMSVQRGENKSNFEDLGKTKKTKKDSKDVDNTIDLLKNLND